MRPVCDRLTYRVDRLTYPVLGPWSQPATALSLGVYLRSWRSMQMLAEEIKEQLNRRSFLRKSGLAAGGVASIAALAPFSSLAQEGQNAPRGIPQDNRQGATATPSLSRQFSRWAFALRYEDLPTTVVDRAKGVTLQALTSALLGS